ENSSTCKPNPAYYREILQKRGLRPEECLMVGNDVDEDMVAETLGMKVFLLTDCLINKNGGDLSCWAHGGFDDLRSYLMENAHADL
ncbi:MAG: HAD hydrolase-like protein, partial [Oscillospiraceae bacterium]|nr:HAD hydrolase-like protein [Oscillospiraceae bacterium]